MRFQIQVNCVCQNPCQIWKHRILHELVCKEYFRKYWPLEIGNGCWTEGLALERNPVLECCHSQWRKQEYPPETFSTVKHKKRVTQLNDDCIYWYFIVTQKWCKGDEYFNFLKPLGMVAHVIDKANSKLVNILTHLATKKTVAGEDHNKSRLILLQICWMHIFLCFIWHPVAKMHAT